jgi:hypothetical protein
MGSRLRKLLVALLTVSLISGTANAATKKPTPTPTTKATAKSSTKASTKATTKATPTSKSTTKATPKTTSKTTAKATAKATASPTKKKVVYKPVPRKTVKLTPSPSAIWPPKGYVKSDDIYAKVPTSKELIGLASSNKTLTMNLAACENLTCGAISAASLSGCSWWEFTGDVIGPTSDTDKTIIKYGTLTSLFGSTKPKQIQTFIMVSEEPVKNGFIVTNINMACHKVAAPEDLKIPSNTYVKNE